GGFLGGFPCVHGLQAIDLAFLVDRGEAVGPRAPQSLCLGTLRDHHAGHAAPGILARVENAAARLPSLVATAIPFVDDGRILFPIRLAHDFEPLPVAELE